MIAWGACRRIASGVAILVLSSAPGVTALCAATCAPRPAVSTMTASEDSDPANAHRHHDAMAVSTASVASSAMTALGAVVHCTETTDQAARVERVIAAHPFVPDLAPFGALERPVLGSGLAARSHAAPSPPRLVLRI